MSAGSNILAVRFSSLGDVVLTTPLLRAIKRRHPTAEITFATKGDFAPLLHHNPNVANTVALQDGESMLAMAHRLNVRHYDHLLDLHGSLRSITLRHLVRGRWRSYTKRRAARRMIILRKGQVIDALPPVAEQYFEAARDLDVVPDGGSAELFTTPEEDAQAAAVVTGDFIVLAPGASRSTKRWPPPHWRDLARRLAESGISAAGLGLDHERELLPAPFVVDAYGLPLRVVMALCRQAKAVVANDSGLMHVATAVGTPVVALFGPTVPAFGYGPYKAPSTIVEHSIECRPCTVYGGSTCPLHHHRCMDEITPASVAAALETVV